jgi:cytochrome c oxidase assembly factor CtaG
MQPSTRFALHFAIAASMIVAVGTLVAELNSDPSQQRFGVPLLGETTAIFSVGTFIWSFLASAAVSSLVRGIALVPPLAGYAGGAAFALLTPSLGFAIATAPLHVFMIVMAVWVIVFPLLFVLGVARWARSNASLERTREG